MRWNPKQIVSTVAVLAVLWVTTAQVKPQLDQDHPDRSGLRRLREIPRSGAQEPTAYLHWKNGDVLPGMLLESKPGTVRWASPHS